MRLKSLKLAGFKSFANSTTFTFPRGITAIVGPNGCGKSNVIDAIRWVLGETSAKQLRGGAMSDVIFAGTQDKTAKSIASVELTFEHTQDEQTGLRHEFNLYHELSVRRQVNLEGRSDYFINGTRCRRRDVVDVFLGTGLGARSYAVIEQGMIGRIVESSPMQLREFIEEAAGVSRYQARREETQNRLVKTEENLARLYDMQSELVRQQKSLARQASSAQRYNELSESLADIKQQLAIQQLYQAKQAQQQHKSAHERSATEVTDLQARYDQLKRKQDKLATQINQQQWLKDEAQSAHYQQQLSYQQSEYQLNDVNAKLTMIEQQLVSLEQQREQSIIEIENLKTERVKQQLELDVLSLKLNKLSEKRQSSKTNEQPLQRAWSEAQTLLMRLQDSARTLEQQQAINTQAQKRHQLNEDKLLRRQQSWQTLWDQLQHSTQDFIKDHSSINNGTNSLVGTTTSAINELENQLQQVRRQQNNVSERLADLQPQTHALQQFLTQQLRKVTEQEKSQALLAGEYDTLHQILHPKPVKKLTAPINKAQNDAEVADLIDSANLLPTTTLREQLELSVKGQKHAQFLDSVLSLWLDSHILINHQAEPDLRQSLVSYLSDVLDFQYKHNSPFKQNQRAKLALSEHSLWLPVEQNGSLKNDFINDLPDDLKGKILPLSELITTPALALWQQCYLYIEDTKTNNEKITELTTIVNLLPSCALLLTADGWIISSKGTINLSKFVYAQNNQNNDKISSNENGHPANSHFLTQRLQQRQRLAQLETLLDDSDNKIQTLHQTLKQSQGDYDAIKVSMDESHAQNEQLTRDSYQYQQLLATEQAAFRQNQVDTQRLTMEKVTLENEQQELVLEQKALDNEQKQLHTELNSLNPKITAAQNYRQQLQSERQELSRNRQLDDDAWQALQLLLQKGEMRLEHSASGLVRTTDSYNKSLHSEQALLANCDNYQQQLPSLQSTLQALQSKRDEQYASLAEREAILTVLKQNYNTQQTVLDTLQAEWQSQHDNRAKQATELALSEVSLENAIENAHQALEHYHQLLDNNGEQTSRPIISVSSLLTDFITHERRVRPVKITQLQNEQAKFEQQLSKIGAVNLAAVAELAEVNERLEPLAQQTQDIAASMQTLTAAIVSIDETTKTLFMQTLDAVNSELAKLFAKVFGGGQASLALNTEDMPANISANNKSEQWRAGLTLMAQPKGKRNSRLAVLSGGEKTLTALSLIFAIFKQHPAPFCVLDEVDAPLDDTNVARFTSLIHELADDLQFIFISHNKLSMQIAHELKGITMPSAGISTLVSVSLDEAEQYIDS